MHSAVAFHLLPLLVIIATSALTVPANPSIIPFTQPLPPTNRTFHLNLPTSTQNLSVNPVVHCDGAAYKRNLLSASCLDAISTIPTDTEQMVIGNRDHESLDIRLPYRWISCKSFAAPHEQTVRAFACANGGCSGWTLHIRDSQAE